MGAAASEDDWDDEPRREYPDIVEFIEARLTEALAVAGVIDPDQRQPRWMYGLKLPDGMYLLLEGGSTKSLGIVGERAGSHASYFDPTWVQRDVAAKRLILAEHQPVAGHVCCDTCSDDLTGEWPCRTVRALVTGFDWHRDFNPEWRLR